MPPPESEHWNDAIVAQSPDAILLADRAGLFRVWNRAAETLFGHAAADVLGRSLDLIIPERLRSAHWEGFGRAVASGHIQSANRVLTTRAVHKDGSKLYVDLSFSLLKDAAGEVAGVLATARDCTSRYASEQALKARIRDLERKL